jgi:Bacterial PH domain
MNDVDPRLISGERFVFTTTKHWAGLITNSIWAILMVLGSFVLAWIQPESTTGVLGFFSRIIELLRLGLFLGGCGWFVYNIVAWRTAEYSVTNLRVLGHEGLIRRRTTDTLLTSLSDIQMVTPALGSLLGFGNIRLVSSGGEAGKDTFTGMRQPDAFKRQVLEQKAGSAATAFAGQARSGPEPIRAPTNSTNAAQDVGQLLGQLASLRDAGVIPARLTPDDVEAGYLRVSYSTCCPCWRPSWLESASSARAPVLGQRRQTPPARRRDARTVG